MMLCLVAVVLILTSSGESISFDPASYLEVYPDPRDPEVLKGRTPLYFAHIVSFGGGFDSSGTVAGVKVALDRINNDSSLLPGYTLHYTLADCQCTETQGLTEFFSEILREPVKLAVLGAGCSVSTEVTAAVSYFYNVTQISCTSSSARLRDRLRFPYYFQLLISSDFVANAYYEVIREYGWKRVALLVQNEGLFTAATDALKVLLDTNSIEYDEKIFDSSRGIAGLGSNPFEAGYRIFYLSMYERHARELLCKAYSQGIFFPEYTLLSPAWYSTKWWRVESANLTCSADDRDQVILSSLAFISSEFLNATSDANLTSTTGITGSEFLAEEQKFLGVAPLFLPFLEYSQYCYDATWTLAYALNKTLNSIDQDEAFANMSAPFSLEDFTYSDSRLLHLMFQHLNQTKFDGITGPVSFDDDGIRSLNNNTVYQYRALTTDGDIDVDLVQIGDVIPPTHDILNYTFVYAINEDIDTVWQGLLPFDGIPREDDVAVHLAITVLVITLAFFGVAFAVICLIFNFVFRETKLIKLASSNLNYLIGIGAIILYIDTVFHVIPSTNPKVVTVFCNLTPWLTAIGYSLCYGTILAKMARVFYIFNNPSTNKKKITDLILAIAIALMIAIDVSIITTYTVVEGLNGSLNATRVTHSENPSVTEGEQRIITEFYIYICNSAAHKIFLGILYGYKMILQAISLLFAFSIRKVKVKGLNDAKFIGASIYVTSIVLAVVIVATYSLKDFINVFAALFCTGFLVGTTVILLLVFLPLMVGLYKDPKGENIFKKSSTMNPTTSSAEADMATLKQRIKQLEDEAKEDEKSQEIITLRQRIKELEDEKKAKKEGNTEELPDPTESAIHRSLEGSRMIKKKKRVTVGSTIWDTPEERQQHSDSAVDYKRLPREQEN